jgi:hypothetical protein
MSKLTVAAMGLVVLLGAGAAEATTIDWVFGSNLHNLGVADKSYASTPGGFSITAHAFASTTTNGVLYEKNGGGEETGLGMCSRTCPSDGEVQPHQFLRVDLGANEQSLTDWKIDIGSVQSGEGYSIYTSNSATAFTSGTSCGTNQTGFTLTALCGGAPSRYLFITASSGDILLQRLQADPVPAPATLSLLGSGLMALAGTAVWRKRWRT